jgi:hypothetical protein
MTETRFSLPEARVLRAGLLGVAVALIASSFPYAAEAQGTFPQYQQYQQGQEPQQTPTPTNVVPGLASPGAQPAAPNPFVQAWQNGSMTQSGNFWQSFMANRVNAGTMLTGTMQDSLSSKNNNVGDVFAIMLDQGYSVQDKVVIPAGSKVLGSVTQVTPAKAMRNGAPGNLSISIQTIVFPDGRSAPIAAFVQINPNAAANRNTVAGKKGQSLDKSVPLAAYGNSVKGMGYSAVGSMTRMFGVRYSPQRHIHAGAEFSIDKGEPLAIRLTRPLELSTLSAPTAPNWGATGANPQAPANGAPGWAAPSGGPNFNLGPGPQNASVPGQNEPF